MPEVPLPAICYCSAVLLLTRWPENAIIKAQYQTQLGVFTATASAAFCEHDFWTEGWGEKEGVFTVIWSNSCFISSRNTRLWQFDGLTVSGLVVQRKWERGHDASLFKVPISEPYQICYCWTLRRKKKSLQWLCKLNLSIVLCKDFP